MTVQNEGAHAGEFLLSEAPGQRSRETMIVKMGENLKAGTIVGEITRGIGKADIPTVVGSGNGVMSNVFAGPLVRKGNYVVVCTQAVTNGGVFNVIAPSGNQLATFTLTPGAGASTDFRSYQINFTITDGASDFQVGDAFTIVVEAGDPSPVGTGNGTLTGVAMREYTEEGRYRFECLIPAAGAGTFQVFAPNGAMIGLVNIAVNGGVFDYPSIAGTLAAGGVDFVAGDAFEVFVWNEIENQVIGWDPNNMAYDGSEDPDGVLWADVDATDEDKPGAVIMRDAEVSAADLIFSPTITDEMKSLAYERLRNERNILVRS